MGIFNCDEEICLGASEVRMVAEEKVGRKLITKFHKMHFQTFLNSKFTTVAI